eukprot:TRINITY_DN2983_c0_g2_i17.p1 TRINITY_DN2983_c0_g2~~TRINITY_DN2983_c0_g2_i17.p1  ORF type:complete len:130 (+),score=17.97 TRINITY_DN2983_c0_g2_i17:53-442(+)
MLTAECAGVCVTMCCARAVAAARVFVCGVRACFLVEGGGGVVEDDAPADPDDFGEPANDHHFPDPKRQLVRVRCMVPLEGYKAKWGVCVCACVVCVRGVRAWCACVVCVRGVRAWCACVVCVRVCVCVC